MHFSNLRVYLFNPKRIYKISAMGALYKILKNYVFLWSINGAASLRKTVFIDFIFHVVYAKSHEKVFSTERNFKTGLINC